MYLSPILYFLHFYNIYIYIYIIHDILHIIDLFYYMSDITVYNILEYIYIYIWYCTILYTVHCVKKNVLRSPYYKAVLPAAAASPGLECGLHSRRDAPLSAERESKGWKGLEGLSCGMLLFVRSFPKDSGEWVRCFGFGNVKVQACF